jgi:hypothetical protein
MHHAGQHVIYMHVINDVRHQSTDRSIFSCCTTALNLPQLEAGPAANVYQLVLLCTREQRVAEVQLLLLLGERSP